MTSIEKMQNSPQFKFYYGWRLICQMYKDKLGMDVTPQMIFILEALTKDKSITMNELSKALKLDSSAVSTLISRWEKKKMVKRTHGTEDRRTVFVQLTQHGEDVKHINQASVKILDGDIKGEFSFTNTDSLEEIIEGFEKTSKRLHESNK